MKENRIDITLKWQKKKDSRIRKFILRNKDIITIVTSISSLLVTIIVAVVISSQQLKISKEQASISNQNLGLSKQMAKANKNNSGLAFHFDIDNSKLTKETYVFKDEKGEDVKIDSPVISIIIDQGAINKITGIKMDDEGIVSATVVLTAKDFIDKDSKKWRPSMWGEISVRSIKNLTKDTFMLYDYYFILAEDFNSNKELILISYDIDMNQKRCIVKQYYYEETIMLDNKKWVEDLENAPRVEQFQNFKKLQKMLIDNEL